MSTLLVRNAANPLWVCRVFHRKLLKLGIEVSQTQGRDY